MAYFYSEVLATDIHLPPIVQRLIHCFRCMLKLVGDLKLCGGFLRELFLPTSPLNQITITTEPDTPSPPRLQMAGQRPAHKCAPADPAMLASTLRMIWSLIMVVNSRRTGCGSSKTPKYALFISAKLPISVTKTLTLTTCPRLEPACSRIASRFFKICVYNKRNQLVSFG